MPIQPSTIAGLLKIADALTDGLQPYVLHYAFVSQTASGAKTYKSAVKVKAIVTEKQQLIKDAAGELVPVRAMVFFPRPQELDLRDKITLPDGTTGPIVSTDALVNATTGKGFYKQVYIG